MTADLWRLDERKNFDIGMECIRLMDWCKYDTGSKIEPCQPKLDFEIIPESEKEGPNTFGEAWNAAIIFDIRVNQTVLKHFC